MACMVNSVLVIAVGAIIGWLVSALIFVRVDFAVPLLACCIQYLVAIRGFRNHSNIRMHCGWTIMLGCLIGSLLNPRIQTTGPVSITDELFGFYYRYGAVNASLISATLILALIASLECAAESYSERTNGWRNGDED